jgi:pyrroline-5-carboxylate reductase
MVTETLYGTAKLLQEKDMGFEDVINQVATKGGITEEGLKVLEEKILPIFDEIFEITLKKYEITEKELNNQYKT